MPTLVQYTLAILDGFVALTAIGGGVAMATGIDPLPQKWLTGTPFDSFLLPGLLLAVVVGGSAAVAAYGVLTDPAAGALLSVVAGGLLMVWIVAEVLLLDQPSWTAIEGIYFLVGAVMVLAGVTHGWS
ncbi:hypothetical protein [Halosimplex amylolyticum]|uniref:hypothetical protein n=1 Tax=Halosimplex amylolyticum TaxID=3396616 RepID=UPI003F548AF4